VIDLDNEIVEVVVAREPIAVAVSSEPHWLVVVAAAGILTPGVFRADGTNRQKCPWSRMAVGAPPYLPWPEDAFRGPAVAFALVGPDAAAPQRDRHDLSIYGKPSPPRVTSGGANSDRGNRPIDLDFFITN